MPAPNLDAQQPILKRTTTICPTRDPSQNQITALAIPHEVAPDYLSKLTPSTPINIPQLSSYLHDHPDRVRVDNLITGLTQGLRIGFQGPRTLKEYSNLLCARDNPPTLEKLNHLQTLRKFVKSLQNVYISFVNYNVCKFAHLQRFCNLYKKSVNLSTHFACRSHKMSMKFCYFSCKFFAKFTEIL